MGRRRVVLGLLLGACGRLRYDELPAVVDDGAPLDEVAPADEATLDKLFRGCAMHLAMDEDGWNGTPGEVRDSCGVNPGTATGGATTTIDAVRGRVGQFVGGTSCVEIPDGPTVRASDALTVSAWVYATESTPASSGIVSKRTSFGADAEYSVFLWTDNQGTGTENQVYVDIDTETVRVSDPTTSYLDAWKQITVVYDGTLAEGLRVRWYVDGVLTFAAPEPSATIALPATPPGVAVGCLPLSGPAQSLTGRIDDVVIWTRALDASEVATWHGASAR